ncbi:MgtC/SapB family protein [Candidatus Woesearchaeota archaeon]|jgi:uncharacterized membrane protein (DUF4010 family)|nr:MgtC/SapB family protein [Candidatus Woesearchaeota archaeon]MBT5396968.1 MgtC/SapB family protein [Candidatus Woesearchaeota archaeon]MBT5924192.1 MgtC/SapB family protein [Candidatus Woesearchaeota archaeon]MBT6367161.1 MgtC/SapB family protein [Candidatus Woesearchaeota archaeon]MBT7762265.1 MgtC/SapB family protein [Candidatus Woesearchaeota archaeon]
MLELELIKNFAIALVLGALVGLEREYAQYRKRGHDYAGIRTFPLIALFGALAAYLGDIIIVWVLIVAIILMGSLIVSAYFVTRDKKKHHTGATSEVAGLIVFFVGILCYHGELILAAVIAITMTIILYGRSVLHTFAKKIKRQELSDTLKFAVVAFIILPFLPNQGYGPLELFNPFIIWLMVVFISGISFVGYIFMKWFGEKGITLAGILGGLISSTAVTTSFAARSKKELGVYKALVLGVILANGIMFIRILIEVFVLNRELFMEVLIPFIVLALLTAIISYFLWLNAKKTKGKVELSSPFTIKPALKFGVFFAIILALVKVADVYLSSRGVYLVSFISGFADVDAITVSLSQLAKGSLAMETARNGIIIAALTNVAVKGGIAYWFGAQKFGRIVVGVFAALIIVGVTMMFLI